MVGHGHVVDDRRGECTSLGPAVRWNERQVPSAIQDRQRSEVDLADANFRRLAGNDTDERFDQRVLTVPFDAGNAENLALVHDEVDRPEPAARTGDVSLETAHPKHRGTAFERSALRCQQHVALHHEAGQFRDTRGGCGERGDVGAVAENRDAIGETDHLVEVMGDEAHGAAVVTKMAKLREELGDLLRGEDRRRFVEDQEPHVAVQELGDLDFLPRSDRKCSYDRVGFEPEPGSDDGGGDLTPRPVTIEQTEAARRFVAEDDVLPDRELVDEKDFLMHHADAVGHRVAGRPVRDH